MFERTCIICGIKTVTKYPLCRSCLPELLNSDVCCEICGIPTSSFVRRCPRCREKEYCFNSNYSFFLYSSNSKLILSQYKFRSEHSFSYLYSEIIFNFLKAKFDNPILCPVPTSYLKLKIKKWYQLDPIVRILARKGINVKRLLKKKYSRTQKKLNRSQREENLKDKFIVKKHNFYNDSEIVLFDDVYTTGATVNSCGLALNKFGYKNIYVITLCRD